MKRRDFLQTSMGATAATVLRSPVAAQKRPQDIHKAQLDEEAPVRLDAIRFVNDDFIPSGTFSYLRQGAHASFENVDWRRTADGREDSHPIALYVQGSDVKTIKVKFKLTNPEDLHTYMFRAVSVADPSKIFVKEPGNSRYYSRANQDEWLNYTWQKASDDFQSVDIQNLSLNWQYAVRAGADGHSDFSEWMDLRITNHKLFVLIAKPQTPWSTEKNNICNPWVDGLELACRWARGAKTEDEAGALVTRQIYSMGTADNSYRPGHQIFKYNKTSDDKNLLPSYTQQPRFKDGIAQQPSFDFATFLAHLEDDKAGMIGGVCEDWAAIVLTFSNILGCKLVLRRFEAVEGSFTLNACRLIGMPENDWRSRETLSDNRLISVFDNHVVACRIVNPLEDDLIFDACLAVDEKAGISKPYKAMVPAAMPFGTRGPVDDPKSYLYYLIDPQDREHLHVFVQKMDITYPKIFPISEPRIATL